MAHSHHGPSPELLDTQLGLRVIKVTFFALLVTSVVEAVIAFFSHSAGLLADTVHSLSNTFTTLPLWIAFALSRRRATQQYPYGFYRAEDLAGIDMGVLGGVCIPGRSPGLRIIAAPTPSRPDLSGQWRSCR